MGFTDQILYHAPASWKVMLSKERAREKIVVLWKHFIDKVTVYNDNKLCVRLTRFLCRRVCRVPWWWVMFTFFFSSPHNQMILFINPKMFNFRTEATFISWLCENETQTGGSCGRSTFRMTVLTLMAYIIEKL